MNKGKTYELEGYRVKVKELEEKIEEERERKKNKKMTRTIQGNKPRLEIPKYQTDKNLSTSVFLREQIKLRCLSYRKLASLTGVNYNVISRMANGELPTLDSWQQVCIPFNCSKIELLEVYEQAVKESLVVKVAKEKERYNRIQSMLKDKKNVIDRSEEDEDFKQE